MRFPSIPLLQRPGASWDTSLSGALQTIANGTIPGRSIPSCPVPPDTKTIQCPKLLALPRQTSEFLSRAISPLTAPVLSSNRTPRFSGQVLCSAFSREAETGPHLALATCQDSVCSLHHHRALFGPGPAGFAWWAGHVLLTCTFWLVEQQAPCHHLPPAPRTFCSCLYTEQVGGSGSWVPLIWQRCLGRTLCLAACLVSPGVC